MKKFLLLLLCVTILFMSGCGDKFAKEKEAISNAEKTAMSMQLPVLVKPDDWKQPRPPRQEYMQYQAGLDKLIAAEKKILAEMRKSDAQITALLNKAGNESEKKDLLGFRDKIHQDRINFVTKISRNRLSGDPFIVGVGSTWEEVEMVYGKPLGAGKPFIGAKEYDYKGLSFKDWIGGGVPPLEVRKKWVSRTVLYASATDKKIVSDAGIRVGMTRDEVYKILKPKYVNKTYNAKRNVMQVDRSKKEDGTDIVVQFAMKETGPNLMFLEFKKGRLVRYTAGPN